METLVGVERVVGDPSVGARQEFINVCERHDAAMLVMGADVSLPHDLTCFNKPSISQLAVVFT